MIKEVFTEIGKIDEFDEYKRYSLYMKGLILICTFCVYVSIILGLSIWGVSLTHLVYKIFSIVKSGSFLVSEIVITIIVYIGFTLGVSYISMFIGSKFVSLIDNIKIKECIKFNYKQCVKEKRGEKIKMKKIKINKKKEKHVKKRDNYWFDFIFSSIIYLVYMCMGICLMIYKDSGWYYTQQVIITSIVMIYTSIVYVILVSRLFNERKRNISKKARKEIKSTAYRGKHFKKR